MTRATGATYQHILELVDWASTEHAGDEQSRTVPAAAPFVGGRRR
jgi:hypothetical protein